MDKKQQYLPALLDRLLDDEPKKRHEAYDSSFYDFRTLRRLVLRDLAAILNCANNERELDPQCHQYVAKTVVNYGIAPLMGLAANQHNWRSMEKNIRDAILRFEPRIIPESLIVRLITDKENSFRSSKVLFEVRGLVYWDPSPFELAVNGVYDSDQANIELNAV